MKQISYRFTDFLPFGTSRPSPNRSPPSPDVDVREEYANAFRTESYLEFWTRVFTASDAGAVDSTSTTAARLSSYRLFVEHLLDPDQKTATRVLKSAHNPSSAHLLLARYFDQTAEASRSCGSLLKDTTRVRVGIRTLKSAIQSLETGSFPHPPDTQFSIVLTHLAKFANTRNPFDRSEKSPTLFQTARANCSKLLKLLESVRNRAQAKLKLRAKLKHGSATFLVALTASLTVILATHALALLVAAPSLVITSSVGLVSSKKLNRAVAQLDVAAKGTYILSRDLETINGLVARLSDELEHMRGAVRFWLDRGESWVRVANGEVWKELRRNESGFSQQLDELEEHLYLCFMTINRARNLVVKEILDPGRSMRPNPNILSK